MAAWFLLALAAGWAVLAAMLLLWAVRDGQFADEAAAGRLPLTAEETRHGPR